MNSILIAVGCDSYDFLNPLSGAEADAKKVFTVLTAVGQPYSTDSSRLLLSPSKAEFEKTLADIDASDAEVLTFYFAGHGGTKEGGYYFCLKDSREDRLSLTGYPLNSWLNFVKELRPRYAYLIADSCNSGGTHHDIRDLLSDPRLGQHSASTFACLAAASSDQYAIEVDGGGLMTAELLKVFDGRLKVDSDHEELDLTEIARAVGQRFQGLSLDQRPVAWGLNLFGPGRLCRNPHFAQSDSGFHIPEIPLGSNLAGRIATHSDQLWEMYRKASQGIDSEKVRMLVRNVSGLPEIKSADRGVFVYGLAQAIVGRLESRNTPWEEAEALGVFASCLLRDMRHDPTTGLIAKELIFRKTQLELALFKPTFQKLTEEPRYFLNHESGMGDFYYLPQRLLKFLATVAHSTAIASRFGLEVDLVGARALVNLVLSSYPLAFRALADDQAPAFYVWSHFARRLGWQAELETVFGCLFADFISIQGKIARCDLKPEQACEYILARGKDPSSIKIGWQANPSQLLAVLLLVGSEHQLDESIDDHMEEIDHSRLNFYLPSDYLDFGEAVIEEGVNRTHEIGHDIWTCDHFRGCFAASWSRHSAGDIFPASALEEAMIVSASLSFTDRIPLFLQAYSK